MVGLLLLGLAATTALASAGPNTHAVQSRLNSTTPQLRVGQKSFYLEMFFKANWLRAAQFCRYHGMELATIESPEEHNQLELLILSYGLGKETSIWLSGTDQAQQGSYFWLATGRPITYSNWWPGQPDNAGGEEHCLEMRTWNDGVNAGFKWNDCVCSVESYFVCQTYS